MRKLVIFGTKNLAEMAYFLFSTDSDYTVVAFTVDGKYIEEDTCEGLPVIPFEELSQSFPPQEADIFVAVGIAKVNQLRAAKVDEVSAKGYKLASFLSSRACVPQDFLLQPNTMIMDFVSIHPGVEVGSDTIVWSGSRIALKSTVGDHCWITSGVIGDSVTVGDFTFLGINASVASFVTVGESNVIGAGATVLENTPDGTVLKSLENKPSRVPSNRLSFLK